MARLGCSILLHYKIKLKCSLDVLNHVDRLLLKADEKRTKSVISKEKKKKKKTEPGVLWDAKLVIHMEYFSI